MKIGAFIHWLNKDSKKVLMQSCKKYLTYNHNFWYANENIIYIKNISEICDNGTIFTWFVTKKKIFKHTDKLKISERQQNINNKKQYKKIMIIRAIV